MKTLLQIRSSIFSEGGQSSRLADRFVANWREWNPGGKVIVRDFALNPVPHLDAARFGHGRRLDDQPPDQLIQLHRPRIEVQLPGIGQGERGQVADDPVQLFDFLDDALRIFA